MKKPFNALFLLALVSLPCLAEEPASPQPRAADEALPETVEAPVTPIREESTFDLQTPEPIDQSHTTYPHCEDIAGTTCSTPGVIAGCWWAQASEPSICVCQDGDPPRWGCFI